MKTKIFFNVDTQKDFMNKDGALYVPNAESIKPNLKKLTKFAADNKIPIIASIDIHYGTDKYKKVETELKRNGGPFPDHCMEGTVGCQPIKETFPLDMFTTYITKQSYDVFSNPIIKDALKGIKEAIVYGVATDYCVKAAVLGMLKMGIKVIVVADAIMGVDKKTTFEAIQEMINKGVIFKTTKEVI
jgi:nicotinamidase/pyrazinamidase